MKLVVVLFAFSLLAQVPEGSTGSPSVSNPVEAGFGHIILNGNEVHSDDAVDVIRRPFVGAPSGSCTPGRDFAYASTAEWLWWCQRDGTWAPVGGGVWALVDTGGDDAYGNSTACAGFPAVYESGQSVILQATTASAGAATLDCGPGVRAIKLPDGTSDPANEIGRAHV